MANQTEGETGGRHSLSGGGEKAQLLQYDFMNIK